MACLTDVPLCRIRGDTNTLTLVLTTDGSTPIDITGSTFLLTVDPSPSPANSAANVYQIAGVIIDAPNGRVGFTPSGPQAAAAPGVYFYDIQWTSGSTIRTIVRGSYEIQQDITK